MKFLFILDCSSIWIKSFFKSEYHKPFFGLRAKDINWIALFHFMLVSGNYLKDILLLNIKQKRFIIVNLNLVLILLVSVELVWHNQSAKLTDLFKLIIGIVYMQINSASNVPFCFYSLQLQPPRKRSGEFVAFLSQGNLSRIPRFNLAIKS